MGGLAQWVKMLTLLNPSTCVHRLFISPRHITQLGTIELSPTAKTWPERHLKFLIVIPPLLNELRHWLGRLVLIILKSYTGCLLNERAMGVARCAELSYTSDHDTLCPGPDKYGSLWVIIRPNVQDQARNHKKQLQSERAPKIESE